jgi:hypothetical protein
MKTMRFSIAWMMGFVLIAALGLGGLKGANTYWASGCCTLMFVVLIGAILNAIQGRGKSRAYWVGFAVAGWAYLVISIGSIGMTDDSSTPILTGLLFDELGTLIHPDAPKVTFTITTSFMPMPVPTLAPLAVTSLPPVAPIAPPAPVAPPAPLSPSITGFVTGSTGWPAGSPFLTMPVNNPTLVSYSKVAHSLTALLAGMIGGLYSAWLYARRERREAAPTPEVNPSSP